MVKVVVAVDEDKEVKRGLEEGFIIHRRSIYTCCSTRTEIWWWWKKRKRWTMRWPVHPDPDVIVNCARFGNMEPPGFARVWALFLIP